MKNIINKRKYCKELGDRLNTAGKLIYQRRNLLNYSRQELSNKEEFIKRVKKVVKLKVQLNRLYLFTIKLTNLQFF